MKDKPFILRPIHVMVWEKLDAARKVNGFSPSYQQMCIDCGISRTTLAKVYRELETLGAIKRQRQRERSIETVANPIKLSNKTDL